MKKKMLALVIAGVLACTACTPALAADPSQMEEVYYDESVFDGEWLSFVGGFDLYIPVDWVDVTDEVENVSYACQSEDGSSALAITAVDTGMGDERSIEALAERLAEGEGFTVADVFYNVNDIYCVGVIDELGNAGYAFLDVDGLCYVVCAGPVTEDNAELIAGILNSLSHTIVEEETEE